jgi:UPF0755 protein
MMGKTGSLGTRLVIPLILLFVCVLCTFLLWGASYVRRIVIAEFGMPSSGLGVSQQFIYFFKLIKYEKDLVTPLDRNGQEQDFTITAGEPVLSIANRLESALLVRNADAFLTYVIYTGLDTRMLSGTFQLSPAQTSVEIAFQLQDLTQNEVDFFVFPGWRIEEIAASLATSGLDITPDEFLQPAHNPEEFNLSPDFQGIKSLEGLMAPGTYQVKRSITAHDLIALFLQRFDEQVTPEMLKRFTQNGLNFYQAVTLASIIQKETLEDLDDMQKIAAVFYNRLGQGMNLESDPTAQYALGYNANQQQWWTNPLSSFDLAFDSPFNTYVYPGLPPGPICSPGLNALRAVANPEKEVNYLFFRARCDKSGLHNFADTYDEHLMNECP